MIQRLILQMQPKTKEPETRVTLPLSTFHVAEKLIPVKVKDLLKEDGISLSGLTQLFASSETPGKLIEIENSKATISIFIE